MYKISKILQFSPLFHRCMADILPMRRKTLSNQSILLSAFFSVMHLLQRNSSQQIDTLCICSTKYIQNIIKNNNQGYIRLHFCFVYKQGVSFLISIREYLSIQLFNRTFTETSETFSVHIIYTGQLIVIDFCQSS